MRGLLVKTGPDKLSAQLCCTYAFALEQGVDFVQGSHFVPDDVAENIPWVRHAAILPLHTPLLSAASGFRRTDITQGFRAYSRALRDVFETYELLASLSYRLPRLGYRCEEALTTRRSPEREVPTKISSMRGNLTVLNLLIRACLGRYDAR